MSHKKEQLESALQRTIGTLLAGGMNDPRISGLISVTSVKVSPDGRVATVNVSVLPEDRQKATLHGLRHAAGHIQKLVLSQLRIRFVPTLDFRLDTSLKKQAEVLQAINQAMAQQATGEPGPEASPPDPAADDANPPTASPEEHRP